MFRNLLLLFFILSSSLHSEESWQLLVKRGDELSLEAQQKSLFSEREAHLNQALKLYLEAKEKANSPSTALNERIGDLFLILENPSWAKLYYEKSRLEQSFNPELEKRLQRAEKKLGLSPSSPLKKESLLIPTAFLFFILILSWKIWFPSKIIHYFSLASSFLIFSLFFFQFFSYYRDPLLAIMIQPSGLYLEPSLSKPQTEVEPLMAGSQVGILESQEKGEWLKIIDREGHLGFVPTSTLRIVIPN